MKLSSWNFFVWLIVVAFLLGSVAAIGRKTIDHIWPDPPVEVRVGPDRRLRMEKELECPVGPTLIDISELEKHEIHTCGEGELDLEYLGDSLVVA